MPAAVALAILLQTLPVPGAIAANTGAQPTTSPDQPRQSAGAMTEDRIDELIRRLGSDVERSGATWMLGFGGRRLIVVVDREHDRMRVMTPVVERAALGPDDLEVLPRSNFDRALDARYALFESTLWAVFLHPFAGLDEAMFANCLLQVTTLAANFGSTYSSSELVFGGGGEPAGEEPEE
jgi:hypothetical protein